jgi:glutamate formiminotransferase / formiminotetrahydrofolate cyclodeaminase
MKLHWDHPEPLIECVPNFSEGRDPVVINAIADSIRSVPGVRLLHIDIGYDAHRTVITYIGNPAACEEAAYRAIITALDCIDLSRHQGAHPRLGAVDVFPFIPLHQVSMATAVASSVRVAERLSAETEIPIYLYNASARQANRKSLASIRKGEYEGLATKLLQPEWAPDYGKAIFSPRSGALTIGARKLLVAYNINLSTQEVRLAKTLAARLREKQTHAPKSDAPPIGLPGVRAIGWYMESYGCAQVSTNLVDLDQTALHQAYETCRQLAYALGIEVTGSELIGLVPLESLLATARWLAVDPTLSETERLQQAIDYLGLNSVKPFDAHHRVIEYLLAGAADSR